MARYWTVSIDHAGRRWSGRGTITPDAWVEVDSAHGSARDILTADETPREQSERMLREIVQGRHA